MDKLNRIRNRQRLLSFNMRKKMKEEEERERLANESIGQEETQVLNEHSDCSMFIAPKMTKDKEDPNATLIMKNGMLKHPFSMVMAGISGAGKTNQLLHLLKDPVMLGGYYRKENIYFFSCTAKCDESFKMLDINEKNIYQKDFIKNMRKLIESLRNKKTKKGDRMLPHLVICEDSTADKKFLASSECRELFVLLRHLNASVLMCIHKMNALENTSRYSSHYWAVFPTNRDQIEILYDAFCPAGCDKKTFYKMVEYAYTCKEGDICKRPFFFINNKELDLHKKFGKGFHIILQW